MDMLGDGFIVPPEHGAVWEMAPGRPATFKLLSAQTGDSMAVFEEVVPAGDGVPVHIHHTSDEAIYVRAGVFSFKIGAQVTPGGPGTWIFIRRGTAHA